MPKMVYILEKSTGKIFWTEEENIVSKNGTTSVRSGSLLRQKFFNNMPFKPGETTPLPMRLIETVRNNETQDCKVLDDVQIVLWNGGLYTVSVTDLHSFSDNGTYTNVPVGTLMVTAKDGKPECADKNYVASVLTPFYAGAWDLNNQKEQLRKQHLRVSAAEALKAPLRPDEVQKRCVSIGPDRLDKYGSISSNAYLTKPRSKSVFSRLKFWK